MKLSTLDVLIITFLSNKPKHSFWEEVPPVILDRTTFDTHNQYVKHSPLFDVQVKGRTVSISVATHYNFPSSTTPSQDFAKKCSYWRSMYRQDRLLSFAENGFSALRLTDNAELFSTLLFNPRNDQRHVRWDLAADKCYINGKEQAGSGLTWAWDLFAVNHIVSRECGFEWAVFGPHLASPQPPHIVELSFNADVGASDSPAYIPNGQAVLFSALDKYGTYPATYGPLEMVDRSTKAKLAGHELNISRLNGPSQRMLWLGVKQQGKYVSFAQAIRAICGRKNTYVPRHRPDVGKPNYDRKEEWLTTSKKVQILKDARRFVLARLEEIIKKHKLPHKIEIYAGKEGFQLKILNIKPVKHAKAVKAK